MKNGLSFAFACEAVMSSYFSIASNRLLAVFFS